MFEFHEISNDTKDIQSLYQLLIDRGDQRISHKALPSYDEHASFVKQHPYRAWYLLKQGDRAVGSFYLTEDNCIGLFLLTPTSSGIREALSWILAHYKPLPPIKSVRPRDFYMNVSPNNIKVLEVFEGHSMEVLQISYTIDRSAIEKLNQV